MTIVDPRRLIAFLEDLEDDLKRTQFAVRDVTEEGKASHRAIAELADGTMARLHATADEAARAASDASAASNEASRGSSEATHASQQAQSALAAAQSALSRATAAEQRWEAFLGQARAWLQTAERRAVLSRTHTRRCSRRRSA